MTCQALWNIQFNETITQKLTCVPLGDIGSRLHHYSQACRTICCYLNTLYSYQHLYICSNQNLIPTCQLCLHFLRPRSNRKALIALPIGPIRFSNLPFVRTQLFLYTFLDSHCTQVCPVLSNSFYFIIDSLFDQDSFSHYDFI